MTKNTLFEIAILCGLLVAILAFVSFFVSSTAHSSFWSTRDATNYSETNQTDRQECLSLFFDNHTETETGYSDSMVAKCWELLK